MSRNRTLPDTWTSQAQIAFWNWLQQDGSPYVVYAKILNISFPHFSLVMRGKPPGFQLAGRIQKLTKGGVRVGDWAKPPNKLLVLPPKTVHQNLKKTPHPAKKKGPPEELETWASEGQQKFWDWIQTDGKLYKDYSKTLNITPPQLGHILQGRCTPSLRLAVAIEEMTERLVTCKDWISEPDAYFTTFSHGDSDDS